MARSVLDLGEEITGIITPVSVCMLLVVVLIKALNPDGDADTTSVMIATIAYREKDTDSAGQKLGGALLNAVIFAAVMGGMTFVLFLLFKWRCYKAIYGYLAFTMFNVFFFLTGALILRLLQLSGVHMDWFSFCFLLFNFSVVGILALFFLPVPLLVKQCYTVWVGICVAYIFTHVPEWTTWVLLVVMALYDLAAVLLPGGPLKILVELAIERQQELPALVYEARPTTGPYQRGMWRQRQQQQQHAAGPDAAAAAAASTAALAAAESSGGLGLGAAAVAPLAAIAGGGSSRHVEPAGGDGSPGPRVALLHARSSSSAADELVQQQELALSPRWSAGGAATGAVGGAVPPKGNGSGVGRRGSRSGGPLAEGVDVDGAAAGCSGTQAAGGDAGEARQAFLALTPPPAAAGAAGAVDGLQLGAPAGGAPVVDGRAAAAVPGAAGLQHGQGGQDDGSEAESLGLPDAIKLGLGDFIFYSMLVGRAAMYDMMTVFASYLAIIAGLVITLLLLAFARKALPALPVSIALGVLFYFLTRLVMEPVVVPLSLNLAAY